MRYKNSFKGTLTIVIVTLISSLMPLIVKNRSEINFWTSIFILSVGGIAGMVVFFLESSAKSEELRKDHNYGKRKDKE